MESWFRVIGEDVTRRKMKRWLGIARVVLFGHPISPPVERHRPFFIIGSGRSGTTLTRAILQSHPDVHIPPETYILGASIKDFRVYRRLRWSVLVRIVLTRFDYLDARDSSAIRFAPLYKELVEAPPERRNLAFLLHSIYMHYAAHEKPEAIRWGDKTPANTFNLARIRSVFPDGRFVHLVRDGRDVVSSYMEMGRYDTMEEAAKRWVSAVTLARRFGRRWPDQYMEVRYEDLVSDPESIIPKLCRFLDLDFHTNMLNHSKTRAGLTDLSKHAHLRNAQRPIFTGSVGKWSERLTESQLRRLSPLLEPCLDELGYR